VKEQYSSSCKVMQSRRDSTAPPNGFLFINKHAASPSLSKNAGNEAPLAALVNKHVQRRGPKRGNLQNQAQWYRPFLPAKHTPTQTSTRGQNNSWKRADETVSQDLRCDGIAAGYGLPTPPQDTTIELSDDASELKERRMKVIYSGRQHSGFPLLRANFSAADCVDPFDSTALPRGQGVQPILQFYTSWVAKSSITQYTRFPGLGTLLQGVLHNKMHMYSLLASAAARMRQVSHIEFKRNESPEYFNYKAIGLLREYIASVGPGFDRQAMLDVLRLCTCEWYLQNYSAARTHIGCIKPFWNSLAFSTSDIDCHIHDCFSSNDIFLALETDTLPALALTWETTSPTEAPRSMILAEAYPSPQSPYQNAGLEGNPRLGSCLYDAAKSGLFSPQMTAIIFAVVSIFEAAGCTERLLETAASEVQWICKKKSQALLHRLLSFSSQSQEECVRRTLLIILSCISMSAIWRSGKLDMSKLAERLQRSAAQCSESVRESDLRTWLWIYVTGAFATEGCDARQEWFLSQGARAAKSMNINAYTELEKVLAQYIFFESLQGGPLRRLFSRLVNNADNDGNTGDC
jgi:hypothetical protein